MDNQKATIKISQQNRTYVRTSLEKKVSDSSRTLCYTALSLVLN